MNSDKYRKNKSSLTNPERLSRTGNMMKTKNRISYQKPGAILVSPEPSKDVFSSTKISLLVATRIEGAAELAPSGTNKKSR